MRHPGSSQSQLHIAMSYGADGGALWPGPPAKNSSPPERATPLVVSVRCTSTLCPGPPSICPNPARRAVQSAHLGR